MEISGILIIMCVIGTLLLQAALPTRRVSIVMIGAVLSTVIVVLSGRSTMHKIYGSIPWDVLLILIGLGLYTSILARSNVFGVAAAKATKITHGVAWMVLAAFAAIMYAVSAFLNNITAICLMLPVFLVVLQSLGISQGYLGLFMALILTATNLGGASSPIGDFPAILLISDKDAHMTFGKYLFSAAPVCTAIVIMVIIAYLLIYMRYHRLTASPLSRSMSLKVSKLLYRNVSIDWKIMIPGTVIFLAMVCFWAFAPSDWNMSPDLVCLAGVSLLMAFGHFVCVSRGSAQDGLPIVEGIVRRETDIESALFLGGLFFMVAAAESTGVLKTIGAQLFTLSSEPLLCISVLMILTGLSTAVFSAGPAMGAMLPIAKQIAPLYPDGSVYIGLALSVCAGSSFLLTAATSGPLTQTIIERFNITTYNGEPGRFSFWTFLPYGGLSFCIIQISALFWMFLQLHKGGAL
ncbi:MAG: SLC13 family permease [Thermodesulfobacteriota bacterium]